MNGFQIHFQVMIIRKTFWIPEGLHYRCKSKSVEKRPAWWRAALLCLMLYFLVVVAIIIIILILLLLFQFKFNVARIFYYRFQPDALTKTLHKSEDSQT